MAALAVTEPVNTWTNWNVAFTPKEFALVVIAIIALLPVILLPAPRLVVIAIIALLPVILLPAPRMGLGAFPQMTSMGYGTVPPVKLSGGKQMLFAWTTNRVLLSPIRHLQLTGQRAFLFPR